MTMTPAFMRGSRSSSDPVPAGTRLERQPFCGRPIVSFFLFVLSLLILPIRSEAEEPEDIGYTLFLRDTCMYVWIDLSTVFDGKTLEQLRNGVDLAFECQAGLYEPRRFWTDHKVISSVRSLRLRYYSLSEEYEIVDRQRPDSVVRRSGSMARLYGYLADSIEICLGDHASMNSEHGYVLDLNISVISLTDINLVEKIESDSTSSPPLHYLFSQFLKMTGFGRTTYSFRSRLFTLEELERIPAQEN